MSNNANFICYQGRQFVRTFQPMDCTTPIPLTGYAIEFVVKSPSGTVLIYLTIGSGITVDYTTSIITVTMTSAQTAALVTTGLPTKSVTEVISEDCCNGECAPNASNYDTKIGPTANCELNLTDPSGNLLPPDAIGDFLIYPAI